MCLGIEMRLRPIRINLTMTRGSVTVIVAAVAVVVRNVTPWALAERILFVLRTRSVLQVR